MNKPAQHGLIVTLTNARITILLPAMFIPKQHAAMAAALK